MIQLQSETIELHGKTVTVHENDWDMMRKLNRLSDEAKSSVNGSSSALGYFLKEIYPLLSAVSSGDVPGPMEAFGEMTREDLDRWFITVWKLNPDWFPDPYSEGKEETVTFRDGSTLTLKESRGLPSFVLRLVDLEDQAVMNPNEDPEAQLFHEEFYPRMTAGIVAGDVPDPEVMRKWPTGETNKLYEAAKRMNPDWFRVFDDFLQAAEGSEIKKKT